MLAITIGVCSYIPAENLGQSGSMESRGVSKGSGLDTQF